MCVPTQQTLDQFHRSEAPNLIFLSFLTQLLTLAVVQQPFLAVHRDWSCSFGDTQLYIVCLGPRFPCFPPLALLLFSRQARQYFSAGQRAEGMNTVFGTRGRCQRGVTHSEAQSVITCGLFTASLNGATSWVVSKMKTPAGCISCQDFL